MAICKLSREGEEKPTLMAPWSWTSSLQNCEKMHSCESRSLWYFVMAAVADRYSHQCTWLFFLSYHFTPLSMLPGTSSQINCLHLNPCLRACIWDDLG